MRVEFQGEGTYTYECRKQDCFHCAVMGLKPLPEIYEDQEIKPFIPRTIKKKKYRPEAERKNIKWTVEERQIVISNIWMNNRELNKIIPRHSIHSIGWYIWRLRRLGYLEPVIRYAKDHPRDK